MKKRMFITTIVMMLVLAVALTTSSLAWFSSANTIVTASSAKFTAKAAQGNVNLKIGDTPGSWSNSIALTNGGDRTMVGLIPQQPLVATLSNQQFVWPATMSFNSAKIATYARTGVENDPVTSRFIIDANAAGTDSDNDGVTQNQVTDYSGVAVNGSAGYYYDEFYIHNADAQTAISALNFQVRGTLGTQVNAQNQPVEAADYTCNAYAAFIIFKPLTVAVEGIVPANALVAANYTVVASNATPGDNEVKAESDSGYTAWIPFAAFTIAMDKTSDGGSNKTNEAWQFADLDKFESGAFYYNGVDISTLKTQAFDAISGDTGFILNTANLKGLNNKVVNNSGNVTNTNDTRDSNSTFSMAAGDTYRVAFYFWLDGYTMTEFTDTTVANIDLQISAS